MNTIITFFATIDSFNAKHTTLFEGVRTPSEVSPFATPVIKSPYPIT